MSDLIVIVYPTEAKAEEMRTKLFELQKEYLIEIGDAVIAVKHEDGKVKLNQLINTTAAGCVIRRLLGHVGRNDLPDAALGGRRRRRLGGAWWCARRLRDQR